MKLLIPEAVAVVPEVVLCVQGPVVEDGVLSPLDDLIPNHDLVDGVVLGLVLRRQVEEQLFDVPVKQRRQVGLEVERQEAQVVLLSAGAVVRYMLHDGFDGFDPGVSRVVQEECGSEAQKRQKCQHAHRVRGQGVGPRQHRVHDEFFVSTQTLTDHQVPGLTARIIYFAGKSKKTNT